MYRGSLWFNVRLTHTLVCVEAAYIKWHQAGGPDIEENGNALYPLNHYLFDRGGVRIIV
jgi:putative restriction endonuclease